MGLTCQVVPYTVPWLIYDSSKHPKHIGPLVKCVLTRKLFSYFSTKTYVVGTQKNRLDGVVLLSTQNNNAKHYG